MRARFAMFWTVAVGLVVLSCASAKAAKPTPMRNSAAEGLSVRGCWRVDHYVFDAVLHRNWAVLLDCDHPGEPSRMVLLPGSAKVTPQQTADAGPADSMSRPQATVSRKGSEAQLPMQQEVRTGEAVVVASGPASSAVFALPGTAEEAARAGQVIRVRLDLNGVMVLARVRGPHMVQLVVGSKPQWRQR